MFQLFDKLDPNSDGTGIGLALVKRIIEVRGGSVRVESRARLNVSLHAPGRADVNQAPDHVTILLVEDDPDHAELIRRSFGGGAARRTFYAVESFAEAMAFLEENTPTIIITDWRLPDGDGISLVTAPVAGAKIPVLVMTSYGDEDLAQQAMKAGASGYIEKSDTAFFEMHQTVANALQRWQESLA